MPSFPTLGASLPHVSSFPTLGASPPHESSFPTLGASPPNAPRGGARRAGTHSFPQHFLLLRAQEQPQQQLAGAQVMIEMMPHSEEGGMGKPVPQDVGSGSGAATALRPAVSRHSGASDWRSSLQSGTIEQSSGSHAKRHSTGARVRCARPNRRHSCGLNLGWMASAGSLCAGRAHPHECMLGIMCLMWTTGVWTGVICHGQAGGLAGIMGIMYVCHKDRGQPRVEA